jgi:uncharacterized iron-regulated protein
MRRKIAVRRRARGSAVSFSRRVRRRPRRALLVVGALAALAATGAVAGITLSRETRRNDGAKDFGAVAAAQATPAIAAILKEFDDQAIVAIGESHDLKEAGDFYRALVKNPSFLARVDAIVVEFGNARYQSLIDAYVSGKRVSPARLRSVWQDTTQVGSWDAPMYAAFFEAVRRADARLPRTRRVRVLLGDPPIDWSRVRSQSQWRAQARKREAFMASVIERQVLAKGKKALVIAGLAHLTHGGGGISDVVQSRYPKAVFVAAVHVGFPTEALERRLDSWPVPALSELAGTWIGALPYAGRRAQDAFEGLLYLGSPASLHLSVPLPTVYRDDRYWYAENTLPDLQRQTVQPESALRRLLLSAVPEPLRPGRHSPKPDVHAVHAHPRRACLSQPNGSIRCLRLLRQGCDRRAERPGLQDSPARLRENSLRPFPSKRRLTVGGAGDSCTPLLPTHATRWSPEGFQFSDSAVEHVWAKVDRMLEWPSDSSTSCSARRFACPPSVAA